MNDLLQQIRGCTICRAHLPHGCRPVMAAGEKSKILIIGQAPGRRVHESGIPWADASGDNLRRWLDVDKATFYNPAKIALMPMGFCYPGTGKSGDLPPRPECAPQWHGQLLEKMPDVKLTLLIGQYAQQYYLGDAVKGNLTATVAAFWDYLPRYFPLPHPSPRNNIWMKKNSWFEADVLPALKKRINEALND
ncbi:MAG TPA: uracil-DNA glycosylase family protein [Saprospiraceae bacterium]|nr:uracil-DNA glycosylase family protein [Saprospiraceae bacterium]